MRATGGRDDMIIALSLGLCKSFLAALSCDCRVSIAIGTSKLTDYLPATPIASMTKSGCRPI